MAPPSDQKLELCENPRAFTRFGDRRRPAHLDINSLVGIFFELKLVAFLSAASYSEEIPNFFVVDLDVYRRTNKQGNQNGTLSEMIVYKICPTKGPLAKVSVLCRFD